MAVVCDLDGVIWLADQPIPGAAEAVARLRAAGHRVLFVTNNSSEPLAAVEAKLERFDIPAGGAVLTSAMAAARLLEPGQRVLVCAGPGVDEAVRARGAEPVHDGDADAVIVGFHRSFDYERMRVAARAVRRGARLIGTNDDPTYPTPAGPIPGGGAILAAVATAAGAAPVVAGKPYPAMAELALATLADGDAGGDDHAADGAMVGDRPDTDGRFARVLGWRFALVLSGVTAAHDLPVDPSPDLVAADLDALADRLAAEAAGA